MTMDIVTVLLIIGMILCVVGFVLLWIPCLWKKRSSKSNTDGEQAPQSEGGVPEQA